MRHFNTSGPNIPAEHYTIERLPQIARGLDMVHRARYFTIWAPRQTGKSTYFRQLAGCLEKEGYKVAHLNFENYKTTSLEAFMYAFAQGLYEHWGLDFRAEKEIAKVFQLITEINDAKYVLIIDEVEGINPEYFGTFLHSIRSAYHSRETHGLKSVILVGVTNILGVVQDNASPFNIADNLDVPYFTDQEVFELLGQHEVETGQRFEDAVKEKICQITANQPGLVNGFAYQLVERHPGKPLIALADYLEVENWYLTKAIDKNISNIINKAKEHRPFVERLLYTDAKVPFRINDEAIKFLHANGLLTWDEEDNVAFWVPLYKKALYDAFYPYSNGEKKSISRTVYRPDYFTEAGELRLDKIVERYKAYAKRRGFNAFREKDEQGNFKSIPEAALVYSFETYIYAVVEELGGKIYREAHVGLGRSDLIINIDGAEFLAETKVYYSPGKFLKGKGQLAYYCQSLGLRTGVYLVFCPNDIRYPEAVRESVEQIEGVEVRTYLVEYDEEKWE
jgi:hypothetical protein